jgi:hypothetical protein
MGRVFRIILGLGLIGYGLYSGNGWFYLGIIPLFFGLINWCPLEKKLGGCDGSTSCCSSNIPEYTEKVAKSENSCCEQSNKGWSTKPQSDCCTK